MYRSDPGEITLSPAQSETIDLANWAVMSQDALSGALMLGELVSYDDGWRIGHDSAYAVMTASGRMFGWDPTAYCHRFGPEERHKGHFSRLGGTWWCDTCNSPLCELA